MAAAIFLSHTGTHELICTPGVPGALASSSVSEISVAPFAYHHTPFTHTGKYSHMFLSLCWRQKASGINRRLEIKKNFKKEAEEEKVIKCLIESSNVSVPCSTQTTRSVQLLFY